MSTLNVTNIKAAIVSAELSKNELAIFRPKNEISKVHRSDSDCEQIVDTTL